MSDAIRKVDFLRSYYKAHGGNNSAKEDISELKEIKNELKISNDLKAQEMEAQEITHSPYYTDQSYYSKERVYNSEKETDWKNVRSAEDNQRTALVFQNMKRLNIL